MTQKTLHILNGDSLVPRLKDLAIDDDQLVWREMLCEGPTAYDLQSEEFQLKRVSYLEQYNTTETMYKNSFLTPLLTTDFHSYKNIILWFEYDLFCHINMLAALSHLRRLKVTATIYLVCSGWIDTDTNLKGLAQLTDKQLKNHYDKKIKLTLDDMILSNELWRLYCSKNHTYFKGFVTLKSSFPYLTSCIAAHLKRFPDVTNGLNVLETNALKIIHKEKIRSIHHLTGYILQYQGYYGFGDIQIKNIIAKLAPFFERQEKCLVLTRKGLLALDHINSFYDLVSDDTIYGNCKKYEYCYHPTKQIITKHE